MVAKLSIPFKCIQQCNSEKYIESGSVLGKKEIHIDGSPISTKLKKKPLEENGAGKTSKNYPLLLPFSIYDRVARRCSEKKPDEYSGGKKQIVSIIFRGEFKYVSLQ